MIDTQDPATEGTYQLKLIAYFESETYTQFSEHDFTVTLVDYSDKPLLQYQSLSVIEIPKRQAEFPTAAQLDSLPLENYTLSEIRYKQDQDYMELSALQFVFANGVESPLVEA